MHGYRRTVRNPKLIPHQHHEAIKFRDRDEEYVARNRPRPQCESQHDFTADGAMVLEHPALGHIEKTLADAYRKEIDQEENVWRSLPFFAATLALQLAAVFQLITRLPPAETWSGLISGVLLTLTGLFMFAALCLLAASIAPTRFRYISREPLLFHYTQDLIRAEQAAKDQGQEDALDALDLLKNELAHQFAVATDHNRRINKRRELIRAFAGLFVIASVLTTLFLVTTAFAYYVSNAFATGAGYGPAHIVTAPEPTRDGAAGTGRGDTVPIRPPGPANADRH
jgi:hypothetical protein